jgi:hypothetical protein
LMASAARVLLSVEYVMDCSVTKPRMFWVNLPASASASFGCHVVKTLSY